MNIILTEELFGQVMESMINEALGVPNNIYETAVAILKDLYADIKVLTINDFRHDYVKINESPNAQEYYSTKLRIGKKYQIGTQFYYHLIIEVKLYPTPKVDEVTMMNMGFQVNSYYDDETNKVKHEPSGGIELNMELAVTENWVLGDIVNFFSSKQRDILQSLTHELKHAFDHRKKRGENVQNVASYQALTRTRTGIPPMDEFIFYLYFITRTENIVRPSEVAAELKHSETTQSQFKDFLMNNRVYKKLVEVKNWSYLKMKQDLLAYVPQIDEILQSIDAPEEILNSSPEKKVDEFCRIMYVSMVNTKGEIMSQMMATNPFESVFGFSTDKTKMITDFVKGLAKYQNNFNGFYENEEKTFKFVADKMIRKISKLYDMAKEDKSIENWNLHHDVKGTKKPTYQNEIKLPGKKKGQK